MPSSIEVDTSSPVLIRAVHASTVQPANQQTELTVPGTVKLEVDTPTDWPAVALPFVLGLAAVYFSLVNQRQQIRSSIANYRHQWLQELRNAMTTFIAATAEISYKVKATPTFLTQPASDEMYGQLIRSQGTILLMLDTSKEYTMELANKMNEVRASLSPFAEKKMNKAIEEFANISNDILEKAWRDIKSDLGHTDSLWRRVKNRYTRRAQSAPLSEN